MCLAGIEDAIESLPARPVNRWGVIPRARARKSWFRIGPFLGAVLFTCFLVAALCLCDAVGRHVNHPGVHHGNTQRIDH